MEERVNFVLEWERRWNETKGGAVTLSAAGSRTPLSGRGRGLPPTWHDLGRLRKLLSVATGRSLAGRLPKLCFHR